MVSQKRVGEKEGLWEGRWRESRSLLLAPVLPRSGLVQCPLSRVRYYPERIDSSYVEMAESFVSIVIILPVISSMSR
jgi:hypothetical protein